MKLPKKCFISHSYKDQTAREKLIEILKEKGVVPFIFPPITVAPDQLISNDLIEAILKHEGVIYLRGGYSEKSFWVAFERDYALRAGKRVYAFDPSTTQLTRDNSEPVQLSIFADYEIEDWDHVKQILEYMKKERYFELKDPFGDENFKRGGAIDKYINEFVPLVIGSGGYTVLFWSKQSANRDHEGLAELRTIQNAADRILIAILDDIELPNHLESLNKLLTVQLYGDEIRSEINRMDDLVVRLYWLVYRNTYELD